MGKKKELPAKPLPTAKDIEAGPVSEDALTDLLMAAQGGNRSAVPAVRALMEKGGPAFWNLFVKDIHQDLALARTYGKDFSVIEAERCKVEAQRKDLEGPNPSALERLLVDRILMCLLTLQYAEAKYNERDGDRTWGQDEYLQKRIGRAQHRFLAAVDALARIRKMQLPDVNIQNPGQVNIGQQQVNVAKQDAPPDPLENVPLQAP